MLKCIIFLVAIIISYSNGKHCSKLKTRWKRRICETPGCANAVSKVLKYMDPKIDPCKDFYQFACGKFMREAIMPPDKSVIGTIYAIEDDVYEKLRSIIENPPYHKETKPFVLLKKLYKTCIDKEQREKVGTEPLRKILNSLGGWPARRNNVSDWKVFMYKLRNFGFPVDSLINLKIAQDPHNSTKGIIALSQAELGLPKEDFTNASKNKVQSYYEGMVKAAVILGAHERFAAKALKESLNFEIKLADISVSSADLRIKRTSYKLLTLGELQEAYPSIQWLEYITHIFNISSIEITTHERIFLETPQYIENIGRILKSTSKRTVANYIMWRAVQFSLDFLTEDLYNIKARLRMVRKGTSGKEHRATLCTKNINKKIPLAMGSLYVRKFFSKSIRNSVKEMVSKLKLAFGGMLKEKVWLDKITKKHALQKLSSMKNQIGYADELVNDQILNEYYLDLELHPNNYLKQILNVSRFNIDKEFLSLRQNQNEIDWIRSSSPSSPSSPIVVNAYNDPTYNRIGISAALLQGLIFSNDTPQYMNHGSIGSVIAHEITHGFDNIGSEYDKDGNNINWWTDKAKKAFNERVQCIINQIGNITVPELNNMPLNGMQTQGENIADNGGIRAAYKAYNRWVKYKGTEPYLPGLKYSPKQMFWISYANAWCQKYTPEWGKNRILTNPHLPSQFRVRVPLSNSEAFSKDFHCPSGSNMNPSKKCCLW